MVGIVLSSQFGLWSAVIFLILFIFIGWLKERQIKPIHFFYALYALMMNSFLGYISAAPLTALFSHISLFSKEQTQNILYITVAMAPAIINFLFLYVLERWLPQGFFRSLKQAEGKVIVSLSFFLVTIIGLLYYILTANNQQGHGSTQDNFMILGLFFAVLASFIFLNLYFQKIRKQQIEELKEHQLAQLVDYTKQIEGLYEEIRHFRHDYINLLTSLEEGLYEDDLLKVRQVYESVIQPTKQTFQANYYSFGQLSHLLVPELKSVIGSKLLLAQQQKVDIHLEIIAPIKIRHFEIISFVRTMSILLDNAIEAAVLTETPWIKLAIFEEAGIQYIILENSCQEPVAIKNIAKKGYSSKGLQRGIGLYTVHKILADMPHVSLETGNLANGFSQILRIVGNGAAE
ncbi:GHKL domain-containing protein [Candidatus Enterococcus huntleyi]|uniref:GHKL domain-containing protein n=1 Tax=Candidatus Enterococcus huntleyi TaxID=1857217 RepID=UPI001379B4AC|nr:GHKL domain-containing protein [Enterococcus sp. JM4C]